MNFFLLLEREFRQHLATVNEQTKNIMNLLSISLYLQLLWRYLTYNERAQLTVETSIVM